MTECKAWKTRLDQLTEPLAVRSGMGKLPSNAPGLKHIIKSPEVGI